MPTSFTSAPQLQYQMSTLTKRASSTRYMGGTSTSLSPLSQTCPKTLGMQCVSRGQEDTPTHSTNSARVAACCDLTARNFRHNLKQSLFLAKRWGRPQQDWKIYNAERDNRTEIGTCILCSLLKKIPAAQVVSDGIGTGYIHSYVNLGWGPDWIVDVEARLPSCLV